MTVIVFLVALSLVSVASAEEVSCSDEASCHTDTNNELDEVTMLSLDMKAIKSVSLNTELEAELERQKTAINTKAAKTKDKGQKETRNVKKVSLPVEHSKKDEPYHTSGTVVYYPAKYVLPSIASANGVDAPMEVANEGNMDPKLKELGIDFEGIWWMSDNPVPEELVSFANTVVQDTDGGFPATLMVPNSRKGMWSWLVTTVGTILRQYYATGDPDSHTDFVFSSDHEGEITTGLTDVPFVWVDRFPFYKYTANCSETSGDQFLCDPTDCAANLPDWTCAQLIQDYPDDMWSRPTLFQERSWFTNTTYTLKRIVRGDGSAHPVFWDEFMTHMTKHEYECPWWDVSGSWCEHVGSHPGEKQMQSYKSDTWCERQHDATWGLTGC